MKLAVINLKSCSINQKRKKGKIEERKGRGRAGISVFSFCWNRPILRRTKARVSFPPTFCPFFLSSILIDSSSSLGYFVLILKYRHSHYYYCCCCDSNYYYYCYSHYYYYWLQYARPTTTIPKLFFKRLWHCGHGLVHSTTGKYVIVWIDASVSLPPYILPL